METKHQLLPGHKFHLFTSGDGGTQFVRLFRICWKQIPSKYRRAILVHWKSSEFPHYPSFELSNMWTDSEDSFAQVGYHGMVLRFSASDFAAFPDKIAQWIIAHELAHIYQKALGRSPGGESEFENEADADRIAEGWGFDKTPLTLLKLLMKNRNSSIDDAIKQIIKIGLA